MEAERISEEELEAKIREHHAKQTARLEIEESFILEERWVITEEQANAEIAKSNLVLDDDDG